jgi:hypothetical protein
MSLQLFLLLMILIVAVLVLLPDHPITDWEVGETDPEAPDMPRAADTADQGDDQPDATPQVAWHSTAGWVDADRSVASPEIGPPADLV